MIKLGIFYDRQGNYVAMDLFWNGHRKERFSYELMEDLFEQIPAEGEEFRFGPLTLLVIWNRDSHGETWTHVRWNLGDVVRYYFHRITCTIRRFSLWIERRLQECLS